MKFHIKDRIPSPHTPDSFEIVIDTYHGDMDGYATVVAGPFPGNNRKSREAMTSLLETLQRMKDAYPNGRGGGSEYGYENVEGFNAWFGEGESKDGEELPDPHSELADAFEFFLEWPTEPYEGNDNSVWKFSIFYYDENLAQYAVDFTLSEV